MAEPRLHLPLATRARRKVRFLAKGAWGLLHRHHPILAHLVPMRRCNLACAYCNEYDAVSTPVPLEKLDARVDRLAELGTAVVTISGGEPLLHPELDAVIARIRARGMVATLITNGYYLSPERIARFNAAGLEQLQISIDNVEPDETSLKSLRLLEPKLRWLAEHARFSVNINSVVGSGIRNPEDALVVARRARALGFATQIGIIHDGDGQLKPLGPAEMDVYRQFKREFPIGPLGLNTVFQDKLAEGRPHEWSCRAGSRYLYVDEDGIVSYCSQQRGVPGIPLERYGRAEIEREYDTRKGCAAWCTVNCVQQVAFFDNWRSPQTREAVFPPSPAAFPSRGAASARLAGDAESPPKRSTGEAEPAPAR